MNGKIKLYNNKISESNYKYTLEKKIDEVLNKIKENDFGITWYICSDNDIANIEKRCASSYVNDNVKHLLCNPNKRQYGLAKPESKEIFITYTAINDTYIDTVLHGQEYRGNLLANVVMDELAHIKTSCDHGDKIYDEKLREYKRKYYDIILPHNII